jgi:hypothetical protein
MAKGITNIGKPAVKTPAPLPTSLPQNNFSAPANPLGLSFPSTNTTAMSTPSINTGATIQSTILKGFTPRTEPIDFRRAFEAEPIQTKAPPVVTGAATFGNLLLEAIPRMGATVYGELLAPDKKTGEVNLGFDARRLGFQGSKYETATNEIQRRISAGESPLAVALEVGSIKALDVAFGASMITSIARAAQRQLLKKGVERQMTAWELLGKPSSVQEAEVSFRRLAQQLHPDKPMGSADSFKVINEAVNVVRKEGVPTIPQRVGTTVGRGAEAIGRETPLGANYLQRMMTPDLGVRGGAITPAPIAGLLPGYAPLTPSPISAGLSARPVKKVGGQDLASQAKAIATDGKKAVTDPRFIQDTTTGKLAGSKPIAKAVDEPLLAEASAKLPDGTPKYKSAEEFVKSADTEKLYFNKVVDDIKNKLPSKEARITPTSIGVQKGNVRGSWIDNDDVWTFYPNGSIPEEFRVALQRAIPEAKVMNGAVDFPKNKFPSVTKSQLTDIWNKAQGKKLPPSEAFGGVAGIEQNEDGSIGFDPMKAAFGVAGMTAFQRGKGLVQIRKQEATLLKERIRTIAKGAREGSIGTREQIKQVQQELTGIVKTLLPIEEQGKFLTTLKNTQTPEQLRTTMPVIQERISRILDSKEAREIKKQIFNELSSPVIVKDASGIRRGIVLPEAQIQLSQIKQTLKLTQEEALSKLDDVLSMIGETTEVTPALQAQIRNLRYAAGIEDNRIAQAILDDVKSLKEKGKTLRSLEVANQQAQVERLQDAFVNSITGEKGLKPGTGIVAIDLPSAKSGAIASAMRAGATAEDAALMTTFLMDKLSRLDKGSQYMQSPINKWWRQVFEARNVQDGILDKANKQILDGISDIYKVKPQSPEFRKLLTEWLEKKEVLGTFKDINGKPFELKMTRAEARYHWAQQQNPAVLPTYKEAMGWSDEMVKTLDKHLSPQDKAFVRWQSEGVDSFYGKFRAGKIDDLPLDPIYERQFGAPLGRVEGLYMPLARDKDVPSHIQLIQDTVRKVSNKPSAIKTRESNKNPIRMDVNDISVLQRHVVEMAHYKAFSDFVNEGRKIFTGDVKTAIKQNFRDSGQILKIIGNTFDDLAKDGVTNARNMELLNNLRGNTAVAFIGANPVSAIKQYVSMIAWAGEMPTGKFISGMADFAKNPITKTRFLIDNSQTLRSRFEKGALERDIQQGMRSGELSNLGKMNTARQLFTVLTRINDRIAIVSGGWGNYIYNLERISGKKAPTDIARLSEFVRVNQKAHKEAISIFEEVTVRTQQAGNVENLSQLQRLGSMGDLWTLFQSAPVAQFGNTLSTLRAMGFFGDPKRVPTGKGLKRLFIYLVTIPAMLQFISDGFEFKKRRQAAAVGASVLTLGFSNYPFFIGSLAQNVGRAAAGLPFFDSSSPAPLTVLNEFSRIISKTKKALYEPTAEDVFQAIKDLGVVLATLKGVPAKPAARIAGGAIDFATGETKDPRRLIGFSKFALSSQGAEKPSTKFTSLDDVKKEVRKLRDSGKIDDATGDAMYAGLKKQYLADQKKARADLPMDKFVDQLRKARDAGEITDAEGDAEYAAYKKKSEFEAKRILEEDAKYPARNTVQLISALAKATFIDPVNVFKIITSDERLGNIEGNLVQMRRWYGLPYELKSGSEEYMKKRFAEMKIPWSQRHNYNLEHIVPVGAGGSNADNNLQIISRSLHKSYSDWDTKAGNAVKNGTMTRGEVAKIARDLKVNKSITVEEAMRALK